MSNVAEYELGEAITFSANQSPENLPAGEYNGEIVGRSDILRTNGMGVDWLNVRIVGGDLAGKRVKIAVKKDDVGNNDQAEKSV